MLLDTKLKLKGLSWEESMKLFPHFPILVGYRGSIAHGMYVPNTDPNSIDDKDVMGVTIGPDESYFGLGKFEHKETFEGEWDVVVYEVRKFVRLLAKANPNVLSLLWLRENYYIYRHALGQEIIDNRELFVSKAIYHSFTGYAYGQLKKMENLAYEGYMGEKRKRLVEKFGYDTKNAAHCIRLLRMGTEFLIEGALHVFREDAQQLLQIKHGEWSIERVKREAERLFARADDAYARSKLPSEVDKGAVNDLLMRITKVYFGAE